MLQPTLNGRRLPAYPSAMMQVFSVEQDLRKSSWGVVSCVCGLDNRASRENHHMNHADDQITIYFLTARRARFLVTIFVSIVASAAPQYPTLLESLGHGRGRGRPQCINMHCNAIHDEDAAVDATGNEN
jgi:hypothetical protein